MFLRLPKLADARAFEAPRLGSDIMVVVGIVNVLMPYNARLELDLLACELEPDEAQEVFLEALPQ